jgi:hypothetical protein
MDYSLYLPQPSSNECDRGNYSAFSGSAFPLRTPYLGSNALTNYPCG